MFEGDRYGESRDEYPYSWLNEWLCEYVDGTMDPSLRKIFEEYLQANPELAEHVECLCRTRELLCHQDARASVPPELQERLRERTRQELREEREAQPQTQAAPTRYSRSVAVGSGMVLMLIVGMAVGAVFLGDGVHERTVRVAVTNDEPVEQSTAAGHSSVIPKASPGQLPYTPVSGALPQWTPERSTLVSLITPKLDVPAEETESDDLSTSLSDR